MMNLLNDRIKEMYESIAICTERVYSLSGCIEAAERRNEVIDNGMVDGYENPIADIAERFRTYIYLCNETELGFLRYAAELTEKKAAWEDNIEYYPSQVFLYNDLIYLFEDDDGYYLVLPDELAAIFREVTARKDFAAMNAYKLELSEYAAAMINLYGAYEISFFVEVWNHHHKEKITVDAAKEFFSDRAYFHSDFYFVDGFVVHDCLFYDDFEELWAATEDIDYYMPTKSVIREYTGKEHLDAPISPGELEINAFLAEHVKDERLLDNLQLGISFSLSRLTDPAEILRDLEVADAPIADEDFRGTFERMYNNLRDNSHIWELSGFTPRQYQAETGESIKRFKLPKSKERKRK